MSDEIAIKVDHVSKNFVLPHERASSVKSLFTGLGKRRGKSSETQHALRDISFEVKKGEFFGIVGRNGSGKSTLLKMLAGIYQPTKGSVAVMGKLVPFIELGVGFNPELTGRENIYLNGALLGFSRKEVKALYPDIVSFAELEKFMDQKLKNYSSGMQVRLAFSLAIRARAEILLVDEVLAVGDADFQRKCFAYFKSLKREKKTVVFVSHDMEAVKEYCDRAILINDSELVDMGSPEKIAKEYKHLFIDTQEVETGGTKGERWGSFQIQYTDVTLSSHKLIDQQEPLTIRVKAKANEDVEDVVFGFSIRDAAGQVLLGTNSTLKNKPCKFVKKGEEKTVTWTVPNIFNDGEHQVNVAIVRGSSVDTYDWWESAEKFIVAQEDRTPYPVNPPIEIEIT